MGSGTLHNNKVVGYDVQFAHVECRVVMQAISDNINDGALEIELSKMKKLLLGLPAKKEYMFGKGGFLKKVS